MTFTLVYFRVETETIDEMINNMFEHAGFVQKATLTFDDFSRLLRDYKDHLDYAQLDFGKGRLRLHVYGLHQL